MSFWKKVIPLLKYSFLYSFIVSHMGRVRMVRSKSNYGCSKISKVYIIGFNYYTVIIM